jgi:hypothetical protein
MQRTAKCLCGQLQITTEGEPFKVFACSCTECQRSTGAVLATNTYFANKQIQGRSGTAKTFEMSRDSGRKVTLHFCPECGSTVYLEAEFMPGHTGIPVGTFNEPNFPEPSLSAFNRNKVPWLKLPDHWMNLHKQ